MVLKLNLFQNLTKSLLDTLTLIFPRVAQVIFLYFHNIIRSAIHFRILYVNYSICLYAHHPRVNPHKECLFISVYLVLTYSIELCLTRITLFEEVVSFIYSK